MSILMLLLQPPEHLTVAPPPEPPPKPRGGNSGPNHKLANAATIDQARQRYKKVMKDEWVSTMKINARLGAGRGMALGTLQSFEKRGELVRRPIGGEPFNRRKGYEWKWIK
jgi:hypothetical protein